jgi:hypothetical protein
MTETEKIRMAIAKEDIDTANFPLDLICDNKALGIEIDYLVKDLAANSRNDLTLEDCGDIVYLCGTEEAVIRAALNIEKKKI